MKYIFSTIITIASTLTTPSVFAEKVDVWQTHDCELTALIDNVQLKTDGSISNNSLYFQLFTPSNAQTTPDIFVGELGDPLIHVEGFNRQFSFQLLYTPLYASKMMKDNANIVVSYKNHENEEINIRFPTQNIPMKVAGLSKNKNCRIR